jgi:VWFA-related protein
MIPSIRTRPRSSHRLLLTPLLMLPLLFGALPLSAQETEQQNVATPATAPEPQFTEEIDVRLVTLPVLARDRRGRPVVDLKAQELEVREGRESYRIAFLTPFVELPEQDQDLPRVRLVTQVPGGTSEIARSTEKPPRYLLILADVENDPPIERKKAMEALHQFLERELDSSFRVALMTFDGRLSLLVPFTQDRASVTGALHRVYDDVRPRARITSELRVEHFIRKLETCELEDLTSVFEEPSGPSEASLNMSIPVADPICLRDSLYEYVGQVTPRASGLLKALEGVIGYAAGLDGHTSVLTIGGNVALNPSKEAAEAMRALYGPTDEINQLEQSVYAEELLRPHLDRVMGLAFQNDVSLSFLDRTHAPSDFSARQHRQMQPGFRPKTTAFHAAQQDMDEIAAGTGGAFVASTRVDEGLRESLSLMDGGYYVSFYVRDDEPMTRRRLEKMSIRSTREGVHLKHRRAFEGWRKRDTVAVEGVRGIIQVGVPVQQELEGTPGDFIPLRLVLDPRDLGYQEKGDVAVTTFTVHLRLRTPKGILLTDSYHVLTHNYPLELWKSGEIEPPDLIAWADLPDGDYFAEAVVTVPDREKRGTFRRHLAIRGSSSGEQTSAGAIEGEAAGSEPLESRR